jgi:hypothetical protein
MYICTQILKRLPHILCFTLMFNFCFSQTDSTQKEKKISVLTNADSNMVFMGKRMIDRSDTSSNATLVISGYVSTYYASYNDEAVDNNGFVKFATMAPRPKEFGLNMALISMHYRGKNIRSGLGVHFGDIAKAVWPSEFNMIQEANAGFRVYKKLWIDAGFFRSHIGIESTQPRENITSSMSLANNFEPYYLAGAKLTYELSDKIALQLNSFNSFNSFVETNKNTLIGFSMIIDPNENVSFTYNFLSGDETPTGALIKKQRYYNNIYGSYKTGKVYLGVEFNYGWQEHSKTNDVTKSATVMSGLIVGKYQFHKKVGAYARQEYFSDPDNVLTGTLKTGKNVFGTTGGMEYKPFKNVALSAEGRVLQTDELLFKQGSFLTNRRLEFIACLDLWF